MLDKNRLNLLFVETMLQIHAEQVLCCKCLGY